ncbi:Vacuolar membrane-associated protein iml1 [Smittium culicis]|uniref:Vacuolar membrane-associated protein IML1 n=1 Tax=Smittium culicis TaxID=133412 RepID=A0A1R1XW75_9FUNG|nr:Vacuolar membrane-associated protein iml1 [Smittium culicis]
MVSSSFNPSQSSYFVERKLLAPSFLRSNTILKPNNQRKGLDSIISESEPYSNVKKFECNNPGLISSKRSVFKNSENLISSSVPIGKIYTEAEYSKASDNSASPKEPSFLSNRRMRYQKYGSVHNKAYLDSNSQLISEHDHSLPKRHSTMARYPEFLRSYIPDLDKQRLKNQDEFRSNDNYFGSSDLHPISSSLQDASTNAREFYYTNSKDRGIYHKKKTTPDSQSNSYSSKSELLSHLYSSSKVNDYSESSESGLPRSLLKGKPPIVSTLPPSKLNGSTKSEYKFVPFTRTENLVKKTSKKDNELSNVNLFKASKANTLSAFHYGENHIIKKSSPRDISNLKLFTSTINNNAMKQDFRHSLDNNFNTYNQLNSLSEKVNQFNMNFRGQISYDPCNPELTKPPISVLTQRWYFNHPTIYSRLSSTPKWSTLCMPLFLPLNTDFLPSDLDNFFNKYSYTLNVQAPTQYYEKKERSNLMLSRKKNLFEDDESFQTKKVYFEDKENPKSNYNSDTLMKELVYQRLSQGYQLVLTPRVSKIDPNEKLTKYKNGILGTEMGATVTDSVEISKDHRFGFSKNKNIYQSNDNKIAMPIYKSKYTENALNSESNKSKPFNQPSNPGNASSTFSNSTTPPNLFSIRKNKCEYDLNPLVNYEDTESINKNNLFKDGIDNEQNIHTSVFKTKPNIFDKKPINSIVRSFNKGFKGPANNSEYTQTPNDHNEEPIVYKSELVKGPKYQKVNSSNEEFSLAHSKIKAHDFTTFGYPSNIELQNLLQDEPSSNICLSNGRQIQFISISENSMIAPNQAPVINVTRYEWMYPSKDSNIMYNYMIWPRYSDIGYIKSESNFDCLSSLDFNWNKLDHLIVGNHYDVSDGMRYYRTRYILIPSETLPSDAVVSSKMFPELTQEELRILNFEKFLDQIFKSILPQSKLELIQKMENRSLKKNSDHYSGSYVSFASPTINKINRARFGITNLTKHNTSLNSLSSSTFSAPTNSTEQNKPKLPSTNLAIDSLNTINDIYLDTKNKSNFSNVTSDKNFADNPSRHVKNSSTGNFFNFSSIRNSVDPLHNKMNTSEKGPNQSVYLNPLNLKNQPHLPETKVPAFANSNYKKKVNSSNLDVFSLKYGNISEGTSKKGADKDLSLTSDSDIVSNIGSGDILTSELFQISYTTLYPVSHLHWKLEMHNKGKLGTHSDEYVPFEYPASNFLKSIFKTDNPNYDKYTNLSHDSPYSLLAFCLQHPEIGLCFSEHKWHSVHYLDVFTGSQLTNWIMYNFNEVTTRQQAVSVGNLFLKRNLIKHCARGLALLDGHYIYALTETAKSFNDVDGLITGLSTMYIENEKYKSVSISDRLTHNFPEAYSLSNALHFKDYHNSTSLGQIGANDKSALFSSSTNRKANQEDHSKGEFVGNLKKNSKVYQSPSDLIPNDDTRTSSNKSDLNSGEMNPLKNLIKPNLEVFFSHQINTNNESTFNNPIKNLSFLSNDLPSSASKQIKVDHNQKHNELANVVSAIGNSKAELTFNNRRNSSDISTHLYKHEYSTATLNLINENDKSLSSAKSTLSSNFRVSNIRKMPLQSLEILNFLNEKSENSSKFSFSKSKKTQNNNIGPLEINLARTLELELDQQHRSNRPERALLHYDSVQNLATSFHFSLSWLNCTPKLIHELIHNWSLYSKRCGMKLVEVPISKYDDLNIKDPFRFPKKISLAKLPPHPKCIFIKYSTLDKKSYSLSEEDLDLGINSQVIDFSKFFTNQNDLVLEQYTNYSDNNLISKNSLKKSNQNKLMILNYFHFDEDKLSLAESDIKPKIHTFDPDLKNFLFQPVKNCIDYLNLEIFGNNPDYKSEKLDYVKEIFFHKYLAEKKASNIYGIIAQLLSGMPNFIFEREFLFSHGFVLDVESEHNFPSENSLIRNYAYSRHGYKNPQFIHKSGIIFVQISGPGEFLWSVNYLYASHFINSKPGSNNLNSFSRPNASNNHTQMSSLPLSNKQSPMTINPATSSNAENNVTLSAFGPESTKLSLSSHTSGRVLKKGEDLPSSNISNLPIKNIQGSSQIQPFLNHMNQNNVHSKPHFYEAGKISPMVDINFKLPESIIKLQLGVNSIFDFSGGDSEKPQSFPNILAYSRSGVHSRNISASSASGFSSASAVDNLSSSMNNSHSHNLKRLKNTISGHKNNRLNPNNKKKEPFVVFDSRKSGHKSKLRQHQYIELSDAENAHEGVSSKKSNFLENNSEISCLEPLLNTSNNSKISENDSLYESDYSTLLISKNNLQRKTKKNHKHTNRGYKTPKRKDNFIDLSSNYSENPTIDNKFSSKKATGYQDEIDILSSGDESNAKIFKKVVKKVSSNSESKLDPDFNFPQNPKDKTTISYANEKKQLQPKFFLNYSFGSKKTPHNTTQLKKKDYNLTQRVINAANYLLQPFPHSELPSPDSLLKEFQVLVTNKEYLEYFYDYSLASFKAQLKSGKESLTSSAQVKTGVPKIINFSESPLLLDQLFYSSWRLFGLKKEF